MIEGAARYYQQRIRRYREEPGLRAGALGPRVMAADPQNPQAGTDQGNLLGQLRIDPSERDDRQRRAHG